MKILKIKLSLLAFFVLSDCVEGFGIRDLIPFNSKAGKGSESQSEPDRISRFSLGNILSSTKDVAVGLAKSLGNAVPTLKEIFDNGKQVIAGYPFLVVSSALNKFCSTAIFMEAITPKYTPDINKMQFQLRTKCKRHNFPLLQAEKILSSPDFDPKKKVVILASGWTTNANESNIIDVIGQGYHCRGDTNFIAVDAAYFVDTLYSWSAFNTEEIGMYVAEGLRKIAEVVPVEKIHLIGHSLGAHIVGAAGRYFTYGTGKVIRRITGLDPAKPCFNEGENLSGLLRGDAAFIDVIHSNSGVLGKRDPVGDADFYPNGLSPLPPGCIDILCAHARAWEYYAETVYPGQALNFMGRRCGSLNRLRHNKCPGEDYPMGYAVPFNLKGNYFLEVRGESPFGEKADKQRLQKNKECGVCKDNKN